MRRTFEVLGCFDGLNAARGGGILRPGVPGLEMTALGVESGNEHGACYHRSYRVSIVSLLKSIRMAMRYSNAILMPGYPNHHRKVTGHEDPGVRPTPGAPKSQSRLTWATRLHESHCRLGCRCSSSACNLLLNSVFLPDVISSFLHVRAKPDEVTRTSYKPGSSENVNLPRESTLATHSLLPAVGVY